MSSVFDRIELVTADITTLSVDSIVNAANETLLGGGGVDGAIHRAAGPSLKEHCRTLDGCKTGKAKITPAFELEARGIKKIIHTVGPVWGADPDADGTETLGYRLEDNLLAQCYQNSLTLAQENAVDSIAFPSISTGVFGFPIDRAAKIAVGHVRSWLERNLLPKRVVFCCFSEADAAVYRTELRPKDFKVSLGSFPSMN